MATVAERISDGAVLRLTRPSGVVTGRKITFRTSLTFVDMPLYSSCHGGVMSKDKSNHYVGIRLCHWAILLLILCAFHILPSETYAADPGDILPILEKMESSYAGINDYQAIFHKLERVKGKLLPEETLLLKFQKPLKIYLSWIGGRSKGAEALYVQGEYDNQLVAHCSGVLGICTVCLNPGDPTCMKESRHPITEAGFGFIIKELKRNVDIALQHGEFQIVRIAEEDFEGRPATAIEARFIPHGGRKYYASRFVMYIDKEFWLPVRNVFYDENNTLFEKYSFNDVRLNVGFTPEDFSRYSEKYRFH
jgi:hypothetical protein